MIYKLFVISLFICCAINYPEVGTAKVPCRSKRIDTLLISSHPPVINVGATNNITATPAVRKTPVNANSHKASRIKTRREKIEMTAEKVRKIQAKVDKIEARIREIELQDK